MAGEHRSADLEAFLAASEQEERRPRSIIDSQQTSPEVKLQALRDLAQLSSELIAELAS
jgi:hypothetical protein